MGTRMKNANVDQKFFELAQTSSHLIDQRHLTSRLKAERRLLQKLALNYRLRCFAQVLTTTHIAVSSGIYLKIRENAFWSIAGLDLSELPQLKKALLRSTGSTFLILVA